MVKVSSLPNFFRCPISLELMKDPVTLCTGQTYDRRSIENWFANGHKSCPSTMQVLNTTDVVPNHLLGSLIHDWCASNPSYGATEVPVVKQTVVLEQSAVRRMLKELAAGKNSTVNVLRKLRIHAQESDGNMRTLSESGAVPVLCSLLFAPDNLTQNLPACEEALALLMLLPVDHIRKSTIGRKELTVISWLLCRGSLDARVNAALLLASFMGASVIREDEQGAKLQVGATTGIFEGLVQLLKDESYPISVEAGLKASLSIVGSERNNMKAVEAGLVFPVMEILSNTERRNTEEALQLLEALCSCEEGQAAACAHALTVPLLASIIRARVSCSAMQLAISCLWSLCNYSATCADETTVQVDILMQLRHVIQIDSNRETKHKTKELVKLLRQRLKNICM